VSTHWVTLQNVVEYSLPAVSQSPQNMHYSTIVRYARLPNNISRAPWVYKTLGPEAIHAVWSQKEGVCPACRLIGHRPGDTGAPGAARARLPGTPGRRAAGTRRKGACASSRRVLRAGGHGDTPGEDARNPRCSGAPYLALSPGGAFAHDRGVRRALLAGVHAAPAPPLGRAEGGYARAAGVRCLAPPRPINASKGSTLCAPKIPICAPPVMAPRSPPCRGNTA